jgi:ubiquinone/menaquinone biosynthesis C-methylase UbiE
MNEDIVLKVKERYGAAARSASGDCCGSQGCCGHGTKEEQARAIGYADADLAQAGDGNLGLGCGNPLALAAIRPGMTVLDLGSGAGFDAFLAAERVGPAGRVIGVDMTPEMLALARRNADARGATNVEFREGKIEALQVEDASVDLVISNCVINLSVDKRAVFREIFRVLKPGGAVSLSDLVLAQPLPDGLKDDVEAYVGCIAGASPVGDYLALLFEAGFTEVALPKVVSAAAMTGGATTVLVSATFRATKP